MVDWQAIKTEYITTATSYRKLAEKYGVSHVQIGNVGKQEGWVQLRKQHLDDTLTRTLEADADKTADRLTRINTIADQLLDKIQQAIVELDIQLYKEVHKEKVIEYHNDARPDKSTKETIREEEKLVEMSSIIDRAGIKQIASALRDIKEIQGIKSNLDMQEQQARIDNLRRQADKSDNTPDALTVIFEAGPEEWNE